MQTAILLATSKTKLDLYCNIMGVNMLSAIVLLTLVTHISAAQNRVYDAFNNQISLRRSIGRQLFDVKQVKYCSSYSDCGDSECCTPLPVDSETSIGVCRKMPGINEACGLSVSKRSCPCVQGTTCTRSSGVRLSRTSHRVSIIRLDNFKLIWPRS